MNSYYMLWDFVRTSEAVLLFPLVVLVPGYVIAWVLDILAFRQRMLLTRVAIAVPLSIGVCPVITYYLWRVSFFAVGLFYGTCVVAFLGLLLYERHQILSRKAVGGCVKSGITYFVILAGWAILATLILIDIQIGRRLYFPTVTYDYALRVAFISAISRTGVPPHNPYFFDGHFFDLRYHYFWLILCSIVQRIAGVGVSPRQAMLAGTVWCGIGLLAIVPLYLRFFMPKDPKQLLRRALIGAALLAVTGLDLLPVALIESTKHVMPTIEWWNEQVTSWLGSVMWVPHHVGGLLACLMGFLVLWNSPNARTWKQQISASLVAALMFASASGMSVHVTLVFAAFLTSWIVIAWLRSHRTSASLISVSGLTALGLSLPFLLPMIARQPGMPGMAESSTVPFEFAVRSFVILDILMDLGASHTWQTNLTNLLALPLNYFLELGFFLVVGVIQCTRMWRDRHNVSEQQLCSLAMVVTSVVICTFVKSTVILANDLGWRGFLIAQFVLLIWGVDLLADGLLSARTIGGAFKRHLVVITLTFGIAGTLYEAVKTRFYPLQQDTTSVPIYAWLSHDRNLGARTFALREIYQELKHRTPETAVFQHNPNAEPQDLFHGMYADRQLAAETPSCAVVFGGDASVCRSRIGSIEALFDNPKAFHPSEIDDACRQLSINVLVVKDTDKVWHDPESWVWHRTPMVANNYARAFDCGSAPVTLTGIR